MASGYPPDRGRRGDRHAAPDDQRPKRADRRSADVSDAIRQMIVDKVNDTVAAKVADRTAKHSAKLDKLAPPGRDVLDLWTRQSPGTRRPRFTRDEIAHAAL